MTYEVYPSMCNVLYTMPIVVLGWAALSYVLTPACLRWIINWLWVLVNFDS